MLTIFRATFRRRSGGADARFDDRLDRVIAGVAPGDLPDLNDEERGEQEAARLLHRALAPSGEAPASVRNRVWQTVQARIAADALVPETARPSTADRFRPPRPIGRRVLYALVGAAALLLLLMAVPAPMRRQPARPGYEASSPVIAFLQAARSAEAAELTIPAGQVLHCTATMTHPWGDGSTTWSGGRQIWLDPQRQLARIEIAGDPKSPKEPPVLMRRVFDGTTAWQVQPNVPHLGLIQLGATTYDAMARESPCALADDLAVLQEGLARRAPETMVTMSDEMLDGMPVTVLIVRAAATDNRTARLIFDTQLLTPAPAVAGLPVRYTFSHDDRRLIRKESWMVASDGRSNVKVLGPMEQRLNYELLPAEQYPAAFFSAEAIAQP